MPVEVLHGSLDERIVRYLLETYPVSVARLARDLRIPAPRLQRHLKGMALRGILELEPLPDVTYVRLLRTDFAFYGIKESQKKRYKHSGGTRPKGKDPEGPMFG